MGNETNISKNLLSELEELLKLFHQHRGLNQNKQPSQNVDKIYDLLTAADLNSLFPQLRQHPLFKNLNGLSENTVTQIYKIAIARRLKENGLIDEKGEIVLALVKTLGLDKQEYVKQLCAKLAQNPNSKREKKQRPINYVPQPIPV